jgi:hypothetical protein
VQQRRDPPVRVGAGGPLLAVEQAGRSAGGPAESAAPSVNTRTPNQAVTASPSPASRAVRSASRSARALIPIRFWYRSEPNASAHAPQSPSRPGRMASASPLRTSSDTTAPGAASVAMARSTGAGSPAYISTPWQSTTGKRESPARSG